MELKRLNDSCHCATVLMCYDLHECRAHFMQVLENKIEKFGCRVNEEREREKE
jgi:hypothetical protein